MSALGSRDVREQPVELIRLAAQPEYQHTTCVRMTGQRCNQFARAIEIAAELRAAELMREGVHPIDATGKTRIGDTGNALCRAANAADGAENPDLIAGTDASVRASIAHERCHCRRCCRGARHGFVAIFVQPCQACDYVVRMYVRAACDIAQRATDRPAVLADRL